MKKSLKIKLITAFILTSLIPILLIITFAFYNSSTIIKDNLDELTEVNLEKTKYGLDIWLESYSDIMFQIYTDDQIVALVDKINNNEDVALSKNQLRRAIQGLFYTKKYIESITIMTDNNTIVFYDQLTGSSLVNSWMENYPLSKSEIYQSISEDNSTHFFPTHQAITFASKNYYLFHIGHRIIDYRDLGKKSGIVIISINEDMLRQACNYVPENSDNLIGFNFIVDDKGTIISYDDTELIGTQLDVEGLSESDRVSVYQSFINNQKKFERQYTSVYLTYDEVFDWDIINVSNQGATVQKIKNQQKVLIMTLLFSVLLIVLLILILTDRLTDSINKVITAMKRAGKGQLSVRVEITKNMPAEIETIVLQFNQMLEKVESSIKSEKIANDKQKEALIKALEAQINPHFLYNTLDTINWMAIDKNEFEISNAIGALASILRYGINNSNSIVTFEDEIEWLKQYVYLQQSRLKNNFKCNIYLAPELKDEQIHKLLLQPFVENAIIHGFEGVQHEHQLDVEITSEEDQIIIKIVDNGKGIKESIKNDLNEGKFDTIGDKNHIGMENAITRLKMYYGESVKIVIHSELGYGTEVVIMVPRKASIV